MSHDEVKILFEEAVAELNEQLPDHERIICDENTRFIGANSSIDSISFVTLISIIEDLVDDKFSKSIQLVDEKAFSSKNSPFYSVETFINHIEELLNK